MKFSDYVEERMKRYLKLDEAITRAGADDAVEEHRFHKILTDHNFIHASQRYSGSMQEVIHHYKHPSGHKITIANPTPTSIHKRISWYHDNEHGVAVADAFRKGDKSLKDHLEKHFPSK